MNNRVSGVLVVHSAPLALTSHIEWSVNTLVGEPLKYRWRAQPLSRESVRVEVYWNALAGTGAKIASELRGWSETRFEVVEDPGTHYEGARYSFTPACGLHGVTIDAAGNAVLTEARISSILLEAGNDLGSVRRLFDAALGGPWDRELEPYRAAVYDSGIALLHGAG
jgi:hypothetical protein